MKIFLLATTILLLINRIKSTPRMLSKTLYTKGLSKSLDNLKKSLKDKEEDEDFVAFMQILIIILITLFMLFSLIYYSLVYNRFSSDLALSTAKYLTDEKVIKGWL